MGKLPEFNTIPIKGISEKEWGNYTVAKIVQLENIKQATLTRTTNTNWINSRGRQYKVNSDVTNVYRIISGTGKWNGNQKHIDTFNVDVDERKAKNFIWLTIIEKEFVNTYNSQGDAARSLGGIYTSWKTGISNVINGTRFAFKDYWFEKAEDNFKL